MAFFSRWFRLPQTDTTPRRRTRGGKVLLRFEPLEERRLLAAVPNNFIVENVVDDFLDKDDARGRESEIKLRWDDNGASGGYKIESSINGLEGAAGFWQTFKTVPAGFDDTDADRFRALYFRIQSIPPDDPAVWSAVIDIDSRPRYDAEDGTVKVSAIAHSQIDVPLIAATIELRWPDELAYRDADYTISRKEKDELSFTQVASLTWDGQNPITGWTDENLGSKTAYEYKVQRHRKEDDSVPPNFYFTFSNTATGYVYAGVDVPLDDPDSTIESPGAVMLVIDISLTGMVPDEMDRLEDDMRAEGWEVLKIYVSPHDDLNPQSAENLANIESKRNEIIDAYEDPNIDLKAVLLLGHVPIPMSGWNNPDGHGARPMPADVYYGDVDGVWSDDVEWCVTSCGPLLPEISNRRPRWTTLSLAI